VRLCPLNMCTELRVEDWNVKKKQTKSGPKHAHYFEYSISSSERRSDAEKCGGLYFTLDLVIITNLLRHLTFKLNGIVCESIYDLL